jgi:hypothetical protein
MPVAVMEAMKMENILRAARAATVKATPVKAGGSVAVDQVIVEFESPKRWRRSRSSRTDPGQISDCSSQIRKTHHQSNLGGI